MSSSAPNFKPQRLGRLLIVTLEAASIGAVLVRVATFS